MENEFEEIVFSPLRDDVSFANSSSATDGNSTDISNYGTPSFSAGDSLVLQNPFDLINKYESSKRKSNDTRIVMKNKQSEELKNFIGSQNLETDLKYVSKDDSRMDSSNSNFDRRHKELEGKRNSEVQINNMGNENGQIVNGNSVLIRTIRNQENINVVPKGIKDVEHKMKHSNENISAKIALKGSQSNSQCTGSKKTKMHNNPYNNKKISNVCSCFSKKNMISSGTQTDAETIYDCKMNSSNEGKKTENNEFCLESIPVYRGQESTEQIIHDSVSMECDNIRQMLYLQQMALYRHVNTIMIQLREQSETMHKHLFEIIKELSKINSLLRQSAGL